MCLSEKQSRLINVPVTPTGGDRVFSPYADRTLFVTFHDRRRLCKMAGNWRQAN